MRPPPAAKTTKKSNPQEVCCAVHPLTPLQCPLCIAALGGKTTAKTHSHAQLAAWGRLGGRPKKKKKNRAAGKKIKAKSSRR